MGRKRKMSKEEARMREKAYEIVQRIGFEEAMVLLYEEAMRAEREKYREEHPEDLANGHYERVVKMFGKEERVKVPRTRKGGFRSALLPERWKRNEEVGERLIGVLLGMGYSRGTVKIVLSEFGIKAKEEEFREFERKMRGYIETINTSPIEEETAFVYLDGHRMTIRVDGRAYIFTLYVAIGITQEGRKRFLYCGISEGSEKSSEWLKILKQLAESGLKKPLMFITDDLSGLDNVISGMFPEADHQLCLNHLMWSIRRNLPKQEAEDMIRFVKAERQRAGDKNLTVQRFNAELERIKEKHPHTSGYIDRLMQNSQKYWAFLSYPPQIHKHIYTTNPIEAVFRQVKRMEHNNMGFLASLDYALFSLSLVLESISRRWSRPLPAFSSAYYDLRLISALKYFTQV